LAAALQRYVDYDFVVIPVGIGCHIDHLMARTAAEQVWQPMQRQYYLDMPYALDPRRWRLRDLTYLWAYKLWLGWPTPLKHESLRCYQTQIQYLMPPIEWFPEVILTQTNGIV
jgi:LmbE family N-acetylglucosaminyl deacetylase